MKRIPTALLGSLVASACLAEIVDVPAKEPDTAALRTMYATDPARWPQAVTTDGEVPEELAPLPSSEQAPVSLVSLGRRLFHDPVLSRDRTVSCASCHESRLHFTDRRRMAIGIDGQQGRRNTPAIFGVDHWETFFWDGRARTAVEQVIVPIEDPLEMDISIVEVLERLNSHPEYKAMFKQEFADEWGGSKAVTAEMLGRAIVAFEKTLTPPTGAYAEYIRLAYDDPERAVELLDDDELKGLHLYRTKARCMTCHEGALMSDNEFHGTGLHYYGRRYQDLGRYNVTGDAEDVGKFRTPSLLGLNNTKPWMHNGLFGSLRGIINLYDAGGARPKPRPEFVDDPLFPKTTNLLQPLSLTSQEKTALEAFLRML